MMEVLLCEAEALLLAGEGTRGGSSMLGQGITLILLESHCFLGC